jgi:pyruvate/2-oxoglutarate dehydrogenase complex dihydrolipoamide acyltransferase (E2) component
MEMTFNTITNLNEIREHEPCREGWTKLLAHLGKTKADDEPLELLTILESNGFDDALWCLRAKLLEQISRHFQAWCAEQVLHIFEKERPEDMRVRDQIAMMRNDNATNQERAAAQAAAGAAAQAAAQVAAQAAAQVAAQVAALAAAQVAAHAAARDAAQDAALAAAWDAAQAAALAAAGDAQEKKFRKMIGGEK